MPSRVFPAEVCSRIVRYAADTDLPALCLTTKLFREHAEPRLYHDIVLRDPRVAPKICFSLIANPFSPLPFLLPLSSKRYNGLFFPQLHSWVKYFLWSDLVRKTLSSQFKPSVILILQYVLSLKDQKVLITNNTMVCYVGGNVLGSQNPGKKLVKNAICSRDEGTPVSV